MADILINGNAYDWASITLQFNIDGLDDRVIYGISKITYKDNQSFQNNYGQGRHPVSRGRGNITAEASVTLSAEEFLKLQAVAPDNVVQDITEFDVIVTYAPPGQDSTTDTLHNCFLADNGRDVSQNDMNIEVEVNLNPSHITYDD